MENQGTDIKGTFPFWILVTFGTASMKRRDANNHVSEDQSDQEIEMLTFGDIQRRLCHFAYSPVNPFDL